MNTQDTTINRIEKKMLFFRNDGHEERYIKKMNKQLYMSSRICRETRCGIGLTRYHTHIHKLDSFDFDQI